MTLLLALEIVTLLLVIACIGGIARLEEYLTEGEYEVEVEAEKEAEESETDAGSN